MEESTVSAFIAKLNIGVQSVSAWMSNAMWLECKRCVALGMYHWKWFWKWPHVFVEYTCILWTYKLCYLHLRLHGHKFKDCA